MSKEENWVVETHLVNANGGYPPKACPSGAFTVVKGDEATAMDAGQARAAYLARQLECITRPQELKGGELSDRGIDIVCATQNDSGNSISIIVARVIWYRQQDPRPK